MPQQDSSGMPRPGHQLDPAACLVWCMHAFRCRTMQTMARVANAVIDSCDTWSCKVPTDQVESDGTLQWDSTTVVMVQLRSGNTTGLGYTFSDATSCAFVRDRLAPLILGHGVLDVAAAHHRMLESIRNVGRGSIVARAISAVDTALWDLKARLLDVPLAGLFGAVRNSVPVYGSGGFTSYDLDTLRRRLAGFVERGITRIKMKVGREPERDDERTRVAREVVGPHVALMVDANGAYDRKQALAAAEAFAQQGVDWFEEPVSSDDLVGLRLLSERVPGAMEVTAGEYGCDLFYFRRMLEERAVDVLQCDVTRCFGYTGFLKVAAMCEAFSVPLSAHTAPHLHLPCCVATPQVRHVEYFHDHVRIAERLFQGLPQLENGNLVVDNSRPGHGLELTPEGRSTHPG